MSGNRYSYTRGGSNKNRYLNESMGKNLTSGRSTTASRRWVRSTSSVSSTTSSQESNVGINHEKKSETTTMMAEIPKELNTRKNSGYVGNSLVKNGEGPVLRGGPAPSSRVWRRSASATSTQSSQEHSSEVASDQNKAAKENCGNVKSFAGEKKDDFSSLSINSTAPVIVSAATNMKRQGTNKLVLADKSKRPFAHSKKDDVKPFEKGENKLVLNGKNKSISKVSNAVESQELPSNLSRKRPHPSISSVDNSHTWKRKDESGDKVSNEKKFQGTLASTTDVGGFDQVKRRRGNRQGGNIKRIQLNTFPSSKSNEDNESAENDNMEGNGDSEEEKDDDSDNSTTEAPILTDFAYREVSFNSARGKKRPMAISRSNSNIQPPKNMGLVRVKPNPKHTPTICPVILRGISCTDPKCKKRHDLSREAVTPLCSYFQKNGQCLKGKDCPFRHVKVNARAEICPSFSLLGYCEDANCKMKHVRQRRQQPQFSRRPFSMTLKKVPEASSSVFMVKKK